MRDFVSKAGTKSPEPKQAAAVRRRVAAALEGTLRMFADPVRRRLPDCARQVAIAAKGRLEAHRRAKGSAAVPA